MMALKWTAFATLAAVGVYFYASILVGMARGRYKIPAPAVNGHAAFERAFRAHQNTLEWMPIFLPALWLFALYVNDRWAGIIGLAWAGARIAYVHAYAADANKRGVPFVAQSICAFTLWAGAAIGLFLR